MPINLLDSYDLISMRTVPTTAIYLLSAIIRTHGYHVEILDPCIIKKRLVSESIDSLFSNAVKDKDLICLSTNTLNWPMTIEAISIVRKIKGNSIKIALGGLHPTYCYKHIYERYDVDYIMVGEGEETIISLLKCIENNKGFDLVDGLIVKNKTKKNLDNIVCPQIDTNTYNNLPLPAFDLLPNKIYNALPLETSRGCKYNCQFCSIAHRNNWREFDESVVIKRNAEIIKQFQQKYIKKEIFITDDCLTADFGRATRILQSIINNAYDSSIMLETRITDWEYINNMEQIQVFSLPQISRLGFGVECGYNAGLKQISKGLTIEKMESVLTLLERNKLISKAYFSFIIGFPWENMDGCLKTIEFAANLVKRYGNGIVNLNWLWLFPSRLWNDRHKYGITMDDSIFDDPQYWRHHYFTETHPLIDSNARRYINEAILDYEAKQIYLRNY